MYIPSHFKVDDRSSLDQFIHNNSFGTLVSVLDGVPFATPLPFLLDSGRGQRGTLRGHMARVNPQSQYLSSQSELLVMFQGPHGYISPAWYLSSLSVPTWNYMAVHVYGTPRIVAHDELLEILQTSVLAYEQARETPWRIDSLPEEYIEKMACAIVGFEIEITRIEGKFKLSQNRPNGDIENVIRELERTGEPINIALAEAMSRHSD